MSVNVLPAHSPKVTVVIPTYNWATVLPYSIGSALGQTMGDFELLVIGDACSDESEQVVRAIGDPRLQWVNLPANGGSQAGPNNEGLRRARGEYVAYLGHDDLWLPEHLQHLVQSAERGATLVHGLQLRIEPERAPYIAPPDDWQYQLGNWISPTSLMHRTEHARAVGGWRFPAQSGLRDPETDLCVRLAEQFGTPELVRRLTSIKFPAVRRRDVYKLRPCHEQERWSRRIHEAGNPEDMARQATNEPIDESIGRLPDELRAPLPKSAMERHAVRRRIKGLDPGL